MLIPELFPNVALYLRQGHNFILYKPSERKLTESDLGRFKTNGTTFLYAREGDMNEINSFIERHLPTMLIRDDISTEDKEKILYRTAVNHIGSIFKSPDKISDYDRCKNLLGLLMKNIAANPDVVNHIGTIVGHDYYLYTHSVHVAALSMLTHTKLYDLDPDEILDVGIGCLFHDIGLAFLGDVDANPDILSEMEYTEIKRHPQVGYDRLKSLGGAFSDVPLSIVRHHHEMFCGGGYPLRLVGDSIPRSVQISTICDVYSALTSDRPHRKASNNKEALRIMKDESHIFNKDLFNRFAALMGTGH